ncbi:glycosyltransferase family 31 protein, partial [Daldinia sp. EC12]
CLASDFQNDVLVVLQVDATDIYKKLPIHFETVLRCVPNYVIYSDTEAIIEGHYIYDFLNQVNDTLRSTIFEFELYNRLRTNARPRQKYQTSQLGGGLELAYARRLRYQWKLLPMAERALQYRPQAKWFVFLEADTYMVWQNVLEWLARFNPEQAYYFGSGTYVGDDLLPSENLGFAFSRHAIEEIAEYWRGYQTKWHQYPNKQWAGDITIRHALQRVRSSIVPTLPYLQVNSLSSIDWAALGPNEQSGCPAPMTFHHMTEEEFTIMWKFEQERLRRNSGIGPPTFRDIFKRLVYHQMQPKRASWDNLSVGLEYTRLSFEKCRLACESKPTCVQFSYTRGRCLTSRELRLGQVADLKCGNSSGLHGSCDMTKSSGNIYSPEHKSIQSGWIMQRVSSYFQRLDWSCD